jgi:hypothetical protein
MEDFTMKALLITLALILTLPATTLADVDCSDVRFKNQDECIQAKRRNNNDRDINIDCSDVRNQNRDDCVEAKVDNRRDNIDKDDVECRNADDPDVRRECLKRKY